MTQEEIDQIWAEAKTVWEKGEKLWLDPEMEKEAIIRQEKHTEESAKTGLIQEYLDTLLPENWDDLDIGARRRYPWTEFGKEGTVRRDRVRAMEMG